MWTTSSTRFFRGGIVLALALSNAFFLRSWENFLYPYNLWYSHSSEFLGGLGTLWLSILLFAAVLWGVVRLAERSGRPLVIAAGYFLLALLLVSPLNQLRTLNNLPIRYPGISYGFWSTLLGERGLLLTTLALVAVAAMLFLKFRDRTVPAVKRIGAALSVFLVLTLGQSLWSVAYVVYLRSQGGDHPAVTADTPRIVVLLFDETGETFLAPQTRGPLALPALDRFRSEALHATAVMPPAERTMLSVPAYLNGELPAGAPSNGSTQQIHTPFFHEKQVMRLRSTGNIFMTARAAGMTTNAVGFYIPYCRAYGLHLSHCLDTESAHDFSMSMAANVLRMFRKSMKVNPLWPEHELERVYGAALRTVADPRHRLTFIHWPLPHLPAIYNPETKRIVTTRDHSETGYRNNLLLMDRIFAELREKMERAGSWDDTTIILLSDHAVHAYRCWPEKQSPGWTDRRVPFLVKMPRQRAAIAYEKPFNSILLRPLVEAIIAGSVRQPTDLVTWLDASTRSQPPAEAAKITCGTESTGTHPTGS